MKAISVYLIILGLALALAFNMLDEHFLFAVQLFCACGLGGIFWLGYILDEFKN